MKSFLSLSFTVLLTSSASFSQTFEGVITFRMKGQEQTQDLEYYTKGEQVRMEFERAPGVGMAVLLNIKNGSAFLLMPQNKMYMEMNINELPGPDKSEGKIDFRKTGKKETILGYSCEQVIIKYEDTESELWVTKGLGKFVQSSFNARSKSPAMKKIEEELMSQGYFPLRMIMRSGGGNEEFRMDVLSATKKSLSNDLFVVPAGFQRMEMPQRQ